MKLKIENHKQNTMYYHCFSPSKFLSNSYHEFVFILKTIAYPNIHTFKTLTLNPSWFPTMNMNSNSQLILITWPYDVIMSYNMIFFLYIMSNSDNIVLSTLSKGERTKFPLALPPYTLDFFLEILWYGMYKNVLTKNNNKIILLGLNGLNSPPEPKL